jgi:flagellar assembly protein FliH
VSFPLEPLEPSEPPPRDAAAKQLAQAMAEAAEIREQARAEGFEQGRAAGLQEGRAEIEAATEALAAAAREVSELREQTVEAVERDAIELGLALAGKILPAALLARPEVVAYAVQGALRRVSGQRTLSVLVSPEDLETVRAALGEQQLPSAPEAFDLQGDSRVQRGGVIVRTTEGELDAQVSTQLERAAEVAFAELAGGAQQRAPGGQS